MRQRSEERKSWQAAEGKTGGNTSAKGSRRLFSVLVLFALLLSACSDTEVPVGPNPDTGVLEVLISGLPEGVDANLTLSGPEDYQESIAQTRTLRLRPGVYRAEVETVVAAGLVYPGLLPGKDRTFELTVIRGEDSSLSVRYRSVGAVAPGDLAPGVVREGQLPKGAIDDYAFEAQAGVPLVFDFAGTGEAGGGGYEVSILTMNDPTPLFNSRHYTPNPDPEIGFAPPADGRYRLRLEGISSTVGYRVRASYLNGFPEDRVGVPTLAKGDTVCGAVGPKSVDRYTLELGDTPLQLDFSYGRSFGTYLVNVIDEGTGETVYKATYNTSAGPAPTLELALPAGRYELRVTGKGGVVRYEVRWRP